ncbi:MAG: SurA N-terminal domain-containing protein [Kiritimatiellia bacterium]
MFIYHFNRLIRNRILWGIFAVFIALAFVGAGSCMKSPQEGQSVGKINGDAVTLSDFRMVTRAVRGFGPNRDTEKSAATVDRQAWEQIAAVQLAEENGLNASNREIQNTLREAQPFQGPNGFDINRYRAIVRQQGFTPALYEQLVSHQLSLSKIASLVQTASWISPMELENELADMTDQFTVRTVTISNKFANAEMNLTRDDYLKYYEENKKSFALPDRIAVRYIEIPASNYMASVSITEDDMLKFYDDNIEEYEHSTTNNTTETIPFAEVRSEIEKKLKIDEALFCAETNLKFTIYGALAGGESVSLDSTAKEKGVKIKESPFFSATDKLYWAQNEEDFITTAFELNPDREDTRYGVVAGTDRVYVMEQLKMSEAHTPDFEAVLDKLRPQALAEARNDAFNDYAGQLNDGISELLEKGKSFTETAKAKAMNVSTSITYSVNTIRDQNFKNNFSIAYGAMKLKKGEISEPIPVSAAEAVLVYVEDRKPGDALSAEMMRAQVRSGIERRRASTDTFSKWLTWNLKQQNFKPKRPLLEEDEEEESSLSASDETDSDDV